MKRTLTKGVKAFTSMPIEVKAIDKENFRLTMVASTQSVDRHGDTVMQDGWDLVNFKKNPVILNSHNYGDVTEVIARAENTRVEGKGKSAKLIQDWVFAVKENPKAEIAWKLYAGKFLHASSVGFIPHKFAENADGTRNWFVIEEAELLEVSAVSVPANAMALLAKSIGVEVKDLEGVIDVEPETGDEDTETPEHDGPTCELVDCEICGAETGTKTEEEVETADPVEEPVTEPEVTADPEPVADEPVVEAPAPAPVQATYTHKVVVAIHSMENREKRAYRRAGAIINSLLANDEEGQRITRATREQIRKRKVNQAIRELLKVK